MPDFKLGDVVETTKGARFWGQIIAFDNDQTSPGCTVRAIAPGFAGTKHVYPLKQLALRPFSRKSADAVEDIAQFIADEIVRTAWSGLNEASILPKGFPTFAYSEYGGWHFQGGRDDLRAMAHAIAHLAGGMDHAQ